MKGKMRVLLDDEFERKLVQHAMNCHDLPPQQALLMIYTGAATYLRSNKKVSEIHFEEGPNALIFKGVYPRTLAILAARMYCLTDWWGDPCGPLEARHVWVKHSFSPFSEHDYIIAQGTPNKRGSYKVTMVSDHENISIYDTFVSREDMPVVLSEEFAKEYLEFRRRVGTGEIREDLL